MRPFAGAKIEVLGAGRKAPRFRWRPADAAVSIDRSVSRSAQGKRALDDCVHNVVPTLGDHLPHDRCHGGAVHLDQYLRSQGGVYPREVEIRDQSGQGILAFVGSEGVADHGHFGSQASQILAEGGEHRRRRRDRRLAVGRLAVYPRFTLGTRPDLRRPQGIAGRLQEKRGASLGPRRLWRHGRPIGVGGAGTQDRRSEQRGRDETQHAPAGRTRAPKVSLAGVVHVDWVRSDRRGAS